DAGSAVGDDLVTFFDTGASEEYSPAFAGRPTRDVHALMDAVAEIHVEVSGVAEHHLVTRGRPRPRVSGGVRESGLRRSAVGLHLDQPDRDWPVGQRSTEQH